MRWWSLLGCVCLCMGVFLISYGVSNDNFWLCGAGGFLIGLSYK